MGVPSTTSARKRRVRLRSIMARQASGMTSSPKAASRSAEVPFSPSARVRSLTRGRPERGPEGRSSLDSASGAALSSVSVMADSSPSGSSPA